MYACMHAFMYTCVVWVCVCCSNKGQVKDKQKVNIGILTYTLQRQYCDPFTGWSTTTPWLCFKMLIFIKSVKLSNSNKSNIVQLCFSDFRNKEKKKRHSWDNNATVVEFIENTTQGRLQTQLIWLDYYNSGHQGCSGVAGVTLVGLLCECVGSG